MNLKNWFCLLNILVLSINLVSAGNSWLPKPSERFAKVSTGAVLGGFGAFLSGYAILPAALCSTLGAMIAKGWQNNRDMSEDLRQARASLTLAQAGLARQTGLIAVLRADQTQLAISFSQIHTSHTFVLDQLSQERARVQNCLAQEDQTASSLQALNDRLLAVDLQAKEVHCNIQQTQFKVNGMIGLLESASAASSRPAGLPFMQPKTLTEFWLAQIKKP